MSGSSPTARDSLLAPLLSPTGRRWAIAVVPLLAAHAGLLALFDLGRAPRAFVALLICAFAGYLWAALQLEESAKTAGILTLAAILRLLLLPLPATLSDDILRYQWDGRVATAGFNPYRWAPEDEALESLRDERWLAMPHKEVPAVYPPVALGLFSIASLTAWPAAGIKIALVVADILACWLLICLARTRGQPPGRALWYAWNPLVVLEVAGMGHVDGLMVPAMVAAVLFAARAGPGDTARGGAAAAVAVLIKLVPAVALPLWARHSHRPLRYLAVAAVIIVAVVAPVVLSVGGVPPGLVTYGVSWEFDGPIYEPLWRLIDRADLDDRIKDRLDALKIRTGRHEELNHFYPYVYPQLLAKLLLMAAFGALLIVASRSEDAVRGSLRVFGAVILCSATVYPWYLLWLLPWAAILRDRAWLVLSLSIGFSYLPQLTETPLMPWVYLAVWSPFFTLLVIRRWSSS